MRADSESSADPAVGRRPAEPPNQRQVQLETYIRRLRADKHQPPGRRALVSGSARSFARSLARTRMYAGYGEYSHPFLGRRPERAPTPSGRPAGPLDGVLSSAKADERRRRHMGILRCMPQQRGFRRCPQTPARCMSIFCLTHTISDVSSTLGPRVGHVGMGPDAPFQLGAPRLATCLLV